MSRLSLYVSPRGQCVMHISGFSWLAGLFPLIWALHRRLYKIAALILVYSIALDFFVGQLNTWLPLFLWVLQFIVFGLSANRFHQVLLERRGWLRTEEEPDLHASAKS